MTAVALKRSSLAPSSATLLFTVTRKQSPTKLGGGRPEKLKTKTSLVQVWSLDGSSCQKPWKWRPPQATLGLFSTVDLESAARYDLTVVVFTPRLHLALERPVQRSSVENTAKPTPPTLPTLREAPQMSVPRDGHTVQLPSGSGRSAGSFNYWWHGEDRWSAAGQLGRPVSSARKRRLRSDGRTNTGPLHKHRRVCVFIFDARRYVVHCLRNVL